MPDVLTCWQGIIAEQTSKPANEVTSGSGSLHVLPCAFDIKAQGAVLQTFEAMVVVESRPVAAAQISC